MSNPSGRVFISHASGNKDVAQAICNYLEARGIETWIAPRDITPGMMWPVAVMKGIAACQVLVLVFSSKANDSGDVGREVVHAESMKKSIIPFRIEEVLPSGELNYFLSHRHWLDAFPKPTDQHYEALGRCIQQLLSAIGGMAARQAGFREPDEASPPTNQGGKHGTGMTEPRSEIDRVLARPDSPPDPKSEIKPSHTRVRAAESVIAGFDPAALGVIDLARRLAVRCRSTTVTHRLLTAAFVSAQDSYASRVCREMGVEPRLLWALLLAMSYQNQEGHEEDEVPDGSLELERCGPVLATAMAKAREMATDPQSVSERELFRAFCHTAEPAFVEFLRTTSQDEALELIELDLEECSALDPDHSGLLAGLTLRARTVVHEAHRLARKQGLMPIPNRLLLAAFLRQPSGLLASLIKLDDDNTHRLCEALVNSSSAVSPLDFPLNLEACARIVTPTIARARELQSSGEFITERLLLQAFCEVAEPLLKDALLKLGINLDALASREPPQAPVPKKPKKPDPGSTPNWGLN